MGGMDKTFQKSVGGEVVMGLVEEFYKFVNVISVRGFRVMSSYIVVGSTGNTWGAENKSFSYGGMGKTFHKMEGRHKSFH